MSNFNNKYEENEDKYKNVLMKSKSKKKFERKKQNKY